MASHRARQANHIERADAQRNWRHHADCGALFWRYQTGGGRFNPRLQPNRRWRGAKLSLVRPVLMRIWHFRCAFAQRAIPAAFLSLQQGEILEIHYGQEVEGKLSLPQDVAQADKVLQGQGIELRAQSEQ